MALGTIFFMAFPMYMAVWMPFYWAKREEGLNTGEVIELTPEEVRACCAAPTVTASYSHSGQHATTNYGHTQLRPQALQLGWVYSIPEVVFWRIQCCLACRGQLHGAEGEC